MHSLTECESRVVRRPGAERSARVRSGAKSFGARRVHASVPAHAGAHERDLGFPARTDLRRGAVGGVRGGDSEAACASLVLGTSSTLTTVALAAKAESSKRPERSPDTSVSPKRSTCRRASVFAEGSVSGLVYSVRASALRLVFLSACSSSRFLALRIDFWNTARTLLLEPVDGGERSSAELSSTSEPKSSVPESTEPTDFSLPDSSLPDSSSVSPLESESEEFSGSTSCSSISSSIVWRASLTILSGLTFTVSLNWSTVRVVSA